MITKRGLTFKSFESLCPKQTLDGALLLPWSQLISRSWGPVKKHWVWYNREGFKVICTEGK